MKSLVIYFSHTGENYMEHGVEAITKGNTEIVAETIQSITGADLFQVESLNSYPYSYQECCDKAKEELETNQKIELKNTLSSIEDYDVIYIGGPVWWGHYPMALLSLLEELHFEEKTVKPFTTHEGSGLGNTKEDIQKYCKGAFIKEGLAIRGCKAKEAHSQIESWCEK